MKKMFIIITVGLIALMLGCDDVSNIEKCDEVKQDCEAKEDEE